MLNQQLDTLLPYGMVATKQWLMANGMSRHSLDNALKSKKLNSLATGVYARPGVPVDWLGVVSSLQRMMTETVLLGGVSALEVSGLGHYVSDTNAKTIHLYSSAKQPLWLNKIKLTSRFEWHSTKKIWPLTVLENTHYQLEHRWREDLPALKFSCPEKACLEMLMSVPSQISFDHADELMQGMTSLSPNKLQALLGACLHIKVKRLFFWLAQRQGYAWFKKLKVKDYDLGKGKRVVALAGKLDSTYLITVPEHLFG